MSLTFTPQTGTLEKNPHFSFLQYGLQNWRMISKLTHHSGNQNLCLDAGC